MSDFAKEIIPVNLEDEMKQSYLDYAMSVIIGRALPDVRDGLKPVHRRVLYAMNVLGNDWNKPYKKSARVVGDVIGKYHPHGDTAVYDTIVRMAQPFSLRYMLIDGQGNFGSVDGDAPAAMRYTEVRMSKIAHELLADLDKETVDFVPNYDESESEPAVMPTRIPALLINGSSGIAVGMATNIPPHNLNEVVSACLAVCDNPELTIPELMQHIPGPDFPTAGFINGANGIYDAYSTGRGKIYLRARCHFEEFGEQGRQAIITTELPYQVNKATLQIKIADLVKEGKLEGISGIRDESDKDGMRLVIELKRGEVPEVVLNNLYKQTQLQTVFGLNMVAISNGRPYCMNLKDILVAFINHRREIVTRRTIYLLRKARERAHILEGLAVALSNIDEMIALIKASKTSAEAKEGLLAKTWDAGLVAALLNNADADRSRPDGLPIEFGILMPPKFDRLQVYGNVTSGLADGATYEQNGYLYDPLGNPIAGQLKYRLTETQAQAILELRLHRLTGLEQDKLLAEYQQLLELIDGYLAILASDVRLMEVIKEELEQIKAEYSDKRRTEIMADYSNLSAEDLITEEDMVVTMSHEGYVKSQPLTDYKAQRRGGRGKSATATKEEDFIDKLIIANTHDTILCFSSAGKVYWLKVYELPVASRASRGKPFVNLLPLEQNEKINAMLTVREYSDDKFIFMATSAGTVKKTPLKEFERQRTTGKIAIDLHEGDTLVGVAVTDGQQNVMLFSSNGKAIRFSESDVRSMGRSAAGVRGITLKKDEKVISLIITKAPKCSTTVAVTAHNNVIIGGLKVSFTIFEIKFISYSDSKSTVLNVTENGFGKRTEIEKFRLQSRGGQGVIAIQTSERNGQVVGTLLVNDTDEIMLITDGGILVRTRVAEISVVGRNAQGVTIIRLDKGEKVVGVDRLDGLAEEESEALDDAVADDSTNETDVEVLPDSETSSESANSDSSEIND